MSPSNGSDESGERPITTPLQHHRNSGIEACRQFRRIKQKMGDVLRAGSNAERTADWVATLTNATSSATQIERAIVGLAHTDAPRAGLALERFEPPPNLPDELKWLAEVAHLKWKQRSQGDPDAR